MESKGLRVHSIGYDCKPWGIGRLQRLPIPYWLVVALCIALAIVEQVVEYQLRGRALADITPDTVVRLLAVPAMIGYIMVALPVLRENTLRALGQLRPVVEISDEAYMGHALRITCARPLTEAALFGAAAFAVILLLVVLRAPTPMGGGIATLPSDPFDAGLIVAVYILLNWLLYVLIYTSVRLGTGLGALARQPLTVNVFDPTLLLPFGRLALRHSLTLAGLILVLVVPLGRPTEFVDYLVLGLLSLGALASLVFPLRGVRLQVRRAKDDAMQHIYEQYSDVQASLLHTRHLPQGQLQEMTDRANELNDLRKLVLSGPDWPFRDATAVLRAVLTTLLPVLYFIFTELLRVYLLPIFAR